MKKFSLVILSILLILMFTIPSFGKVTVNVTQFQMGNTFQVVTDFKALGVEVKKAFSMGNGIYNWVVDKYPGYNGKVGTYSPIFNADRDNNGKAASNIFSIGLVSKFQPPASRPDIPQDQSNYYCTITVLSELDDTQGFAWTDYCNSPTNASLYVLDQNGNQYGNSVPMELIGQKTTGSTIASVYSFSMASFDMLTSFLTYGMCVTYYYAFDIPYTGSVKHLNWNVMRPILNVSYDAETAEAIGSATYDLLANGLSSSVSNIESSAQQILESQEALKESINRQPQEIADALESKEVEAAESAQHVYDNVKQQVEDSSFVPYQSLFDSLGSIVTACGSTERASTITFPKLTIPRLGESPPIVISEQKTIDLNEMLNKIPSYFLVGLRLVASGFLYWAVIRYCMKNVQGFFNNGGGEIDE